MFAEFITRLLIALPLVCLAAVGCIYAVRQGWLPLPQKMLLKRPSTTKGQRPLLEVSAVKSLSPNSRVAVVEFQGQQLLLGVSGNSIKLLASHKSPGSPTPTPPAANPKEDRL